MALNALILGDFLILRGISFQTILLEYPSWWWWWWWPPPPILLRDTNGLPVLTKFYSECRLASKNKHYSISLFWLFSVAIQCLESSYGIDTSDEQTVVKYQVQKNLLDLFNAQLSVEVGFYKHINTFPGSYELSFVNFYVMYYWCIVINKFDDNNVLKGIVNDLC